MKKVAINFLIIESPFSESETSLQQQYRKANKNQTDKLNAICKYFEKSTEYQFSLQVRVFEKSCVFMAIS